MQINENLLIVDTSSKFAGVAVATPNCFESYQSQGQQSHSEETGNLIKTALVQAKLGFSDLNKILICSGPGSFTGIRIGYALVCGISKAISLPVIELPALAANAASFIANTDLSIVLRFAGRLEYYVGWYTKANNQIIEVYESGIYSLDECKRVTDKILETHSFKQLQYITDECIPNLNCQVVTVKEGLEGMLELYKSGTINGQLKQVTADKAYELMPNYMRAVQAKTIAERLGN